MGAREQPGSLDASTRPDIAVFCCSNEAYRTKRQHLSGTCRYVRASFIVFPALIVGILSIICLAAATSIENGPVFDDDVSERVV